MEVPADELYKQLKAYGKLSKTHTVLTVKKRKRMVAVVSVRIHNNIVTVEADILKRILKMAKDSVINVQVIDSALVISRSTWEFRLHHMDAVAEAKVNVA